MPFMRHHFIRLLAYPLAPAAAVALLSSLAPAPAEEPQVLNGMAAVVNTDIITYGQMRDLVGEKRKNDPGPIEGRGPR